MDFASFSEEDGEVYRSPCISFEGVDFFLVIRPNGSKSTMSTGYIGLSVWKNLSTGSSISMEISVSFKSVSGKMYFKRQITGVTVYNGGNFLDIARFISKCQFEKRKSEFLTSGFLTVVLTLKRLNSTGNESDILCSHCENTFDADEISLHEKKCRIKCPDCSCIVFYENWHDHECQISRTEGGTNISGITEVRHHDRILLEFKQLIQKQENCDVVLRVKRQDIQAHKLILGARSPVFASTFRNDMKEKKTGIVDIEDCDPSIFTDFLYFLYCDDVDNLSTENVFGLFIAADKYDVPDLRKICLEFMERNLSVEIFCETLTLALQHNETELIRLATDFFIKNAEKILVTVKWQSFAVENPTQSNELVIKLVASYKCPKS